MNYMYNKESHLTTEPAKEIHIPWFQPLEKPWGGVIFTQGGGMHLGRDFLSLLPDSGVTEEIWGEISVHLLSNKAFQPRWYKLLWVSTGKMGKVWMI